MNNKKINVKQEQIKSQYLCCTKATSKQRKGDEVNETFSISDIQAWLAAEQNIDPSAFGPDVESVITNLKTNTYANFIQGTGKSLLEAKENWNHVYFLDYDIKEWTAGKDGMKACIKELQQAFPNYLIIKPSNRFGIHVILFGNNEFYSGPEHVFYGIVGYTIVQKYKPLFKKEAIEERIMDPCFFNQFNQRMNINYFCFLGEKCYKTSEFAVFNDNPGDYPRKIESFDNFEKELPDSIKPAISFYRRKMMGHRKDEISTSITRHRIPIDERGRINIDRTFSLPGVSFTGNDLRWRIVACIYAQVGCNPSAAQSIIERRFVQVPEMLAALRTVQSSFDRGIYQYANYLIEQFVKRVVLFHEANVVDQTIMLQEGEYLSDHLAKIEPLLMSGSVYLVSSPNTGKTELAKQLFDRADKCIILLHQNSILSSKFETKEYKQYVYKTKEIANMSAIPNKIICIWDTYALLADKFDVSGYTVIIDEVHNFVTALSYRPAIVKVLMHLTQEHQLWMTGTPIGEEDLMPDHTNISFVKKAKTKYEYYPVFVETNHESVFKDKVYDLICKVTEGYTSLNDGQKRGVFIYDNYNHKEWAAKFKDDCAHYVSIYKDSQDVQEINVEGKSSKDIVAATCYLGEGTDIIGYHDVSVIIPTNRFISELNIRQFNKRFRDAKTVTTYLIQYTDKVDIKMSQAYVLHPSEYLTEVANNKAPRNTIIDKALMLDAHPLESIKALAQNQRIGSAYYHFIDYMNSPFCIYMTPYLQDQWDDVIIKTIHIVNADAEDSACSYTSKMDAQLVSILNRDYLRISDVIQRDDNNYDDVVYWFEDYYNEGQICPYRKDLRDVLQIISLAKENACLTDCAEFFRNKDGDVQWRKIKGFLERMILNAHMLNGAKTFDSSIGWVQMAGDKERGSIKRDLDRIRFEVVPGASFGEQVILYKNKQRDAMSYDEKKDAFFHLDKDVTIFKPKRKAITSSKSTRLFS